MSFELIFTPEAEETYEALISQLQQRWGDRFVIKFHGRVSKSLTIIEATPYLYPIANENTEIRKCILHKNCSVFYKVYDNVVLIVWFWDNRQDPLVTF